MAKVNLSHAAKLTGKNRTTIWRHINSGRLSYERDRDGLPFVDTSELIRVYGELKPTATHQSKKKPHKATPDYESLVVTIEQLRKEQAEMRVQIENLTNRLSYTPSLDSLVDKPEDDPDWPKEIKTMADIILRNQIKGKYSLEK